MGAFYVGVEQLKISLFDLKRALRSSYVKRHQEIRNHNLLCKSHPGRRHLTIRLDIPKQKHLEAKLLYKGGHGSGATPALNAVPFTQEFRHLRTFSEQ